MLSQKIELYDSIEFNKRVLFIVWILVLSKCLILEYYIQDLAIPINSTFFIWSLSLGLTALASYLFLKRSNSLQIFENDKLRVRVILNLAIFIVLAALNSTNLILDYSQNKKLLSKKIKIGYQNLKRFDSETNLKNYLKVINSLI